MLARIFQTIFSKISSKLSRLLLCAPEAHSSSQESFFNFLEDTFIKNVIVSTEEGTFALNYRDKLIARDIILTGNWEKAETALIKKIVRAGDLAIDVGANVGWYTAILSNLVGSEGRVISFEPEPNNFQALQTNIYLNNLKNITAHQIALLDSNGIVNFELSSENFGDHRVRLKDIVLDEIEIYGESSRKLISVTASTLDAIIDTELEDLLEQHQRIRLMKIDCQGSEIAILKGAQKALSKTDYLISEYWPYGIRKLGFDPIDFFSIIHANFISFSRITEEFSPHSLKPIHLLIEDMKLVDEFSTGIHVDYIFKR